MKPLHPILTSIVARSIVLLGLASVVRAQDNPFNAITGDTIVGQVPFTQPNTTLNFVATPTGLFRGDNSKSAPHYVRLWTPPIPRRIKYLKRKVNSDSLLIQLDDGTVWMSNGTSAVVYNGKIGSSGSESWVKVIGDAMYAMSVSGAALSVSRDNGATWQSDTVGLNGAFIYDVAMDSSQNVLAGTTKGLFKQAAAGGAWNIVPSFPSTLTVYTVCVDREKRILVGMFGGGEYASTDNGSTWPIDSAGLGAQIVSYFSDDAYHNQYAITGSKIFRSIGGTQAWMEIDGGIRGLAGAATVNVLTGDSILHAGTSVGEFRSSDAGTTWNRDDLGIPARTFFSIAKASNGKYLASTIQGIFAQGVNDTSWNNVFAKIGNGEHLMLYADVAGKLYTLDHTTIPNYHAPLIIKSTDNGSTWNPDTAGESAIAGGIFYIDELGTQHVGNALGNSTVVSLWQRPAGGEWTADTVGFPVADLHGVYSIASDKNGYLYASEYSAVKVVRRPVAGGAWSVDTNGLPSSAGYFRELYGGENGDMYGLPNSSSHLIYGRHGNGWSTVQLPAFVYANFYDVAAISVNGNGVLFAAFVDYKNLGFGVYFTTDNGVNWSFAGCDSVPVSSMISIGDTTYALSNGFGVNILTAKAVSAVREISTQPNALSLESFPNPFSNTASIDFNLTQPAHVTIKIYSAIGQEIETLVDDQQSSGHHTALFNAEHLQNGVYWYRLTAGKNLLTQKMVVVR